MLSAHPKSVSYKTAGCICAGKKVVVLEGRSRGSGQTGRWVFQSSLECYSRFQDILNPDSQIYSRRSSTDREWNILQDDSTSDDVE